MGSYQWVSRVLSLPHIVVPQPVQHIIEKKTHAGPVCSLQILFRLATEVGTMYADQKFGEAQRGEGVSIFNLETTQPTQQTLKCLCLISLSASQTIVLVSQVEQHKVQPQTPNDSRQD